MILPDSQKKTWILSLLTFNSLVCFAYSGLWPDSLAWINATSEQYKFKETQLRKFYDYKGEICLEK